jgi:hypothetical protein
MASEDRAREERSSAQREKEHVAKAERARQEVRRRYRIIERLQQLKQQAQILDAALLELTRNPEMGLEDLLPACMHLDKFHMELLRAIRWQNEIIEGLEQTTTWFTARALYGDALPERDGERPEHA